MTSTRSQRLLPAALLALVLGLQVVAVVRQSFVGDAAYHLLAGHQALRYGTNSLNLEHPPLVKLVAALPLLGEEPLAPPLSVDRALPESLRLFDDPDRAHRVRLASRLLVLAAFGLPFLLACYLLGSEAGGRTSGIVLLGLVALSFAALPNLAILQTDTAAALGFTLTAWASLRYLRPQRRRGLSGALWLGAGLGLALAAKHSGVLAAPIVAVAAVAARDLPWRRRLGELALAGLVALALLWTTYAVANHGYDPEAGRDAIRRYCRGEALLVGHQMERWEEPLLAVERFSPSAAQYLTGLVGIRLQNEIGVYPSYAFGTLSSRGRWWYFPAVLLARTSLVVLVASVLALLAVRHRPSRGPLLVLGTAAAVYLGTAMASNYNLGIRHLLPILPLLYLPAARWTAARPRRAAVVLGALALEAVLVAPLWMSATNTWWLGEKNPTRFALGSLEYRQSFVVLAEEARSRGVEELHVVYPTVDAREIAAYPPLQAAVPGAAPAPGWYAVNVMVEQYVPAIPRTRPEDLRGHGSLEALAERWEPLWREVARGEDHGYVAGTFHLYRVDPSHPATR